VKVEFPETPKKKVAADEAVPDAAETPVVPKGVERKRISGVFSSQTVAKVGTGTTTRKTIQKAYWFANELKPEGGEEAMVEVQPLNTNNVPSGPKDQVPLTDFLERFNPEIEYHQKVVFPVMKEMNTSIQRAEQQRDQGALYSAEFEFNNALDFDENNVRANFGLGLTYMERGDTAKAADIFERVVGLDAAFTPEHKHLFNEFGINLRKSRLLDQAVDYYTRALEITQNDENLYYNIGRAYFERGDVAEAIKHFRKALEIYSDFTEAQRFLDYINKRQG